MSEDFQIINGISQSNDIAWISVYDPFKQFIKAFKQFLSQDFSKFNSVLIQGDFNIDCNEKNVSSESIDILSLFAEYNFNLKNFMPTYPATHPVSTIDLLFSNDTDLFSEVNTVSNINSKCDHLALDILINLKTNKVNTKMKRFYSKTSIIYFNESLKEINWEEVFKEEVETAYNKMQDIINLKLDQFFPLRKVKEKKDKILISKIRKKRKLSKEGKDTTNLMKEIEQRIREIETERLENLRCKSNSIYSLHQKIKSEKTSCPANAFLVNDIVISNEKEIADSFADHFRSIFNEGTCLTHNFYSSFSISKTEIKSIINSLNTKKASGFSLLPHFLLKKCEDNMTEIIFLLFNAISRDSLIPHSLSIDKVTPVLKPGKDKSLLSSCRPVSVRDNLMYILDKFLTRQLNEFNDREKVINEEQYGFIQGKNTSAQVSDLIRELSFLLDDKTTLFIDLIFFDYSSAFDKVLPNLLISDLESLGLEHDTLSILSLMFNSRSQTVVYNNSKSYNFTPTSGIIQGGVSSPILFNFYVRNVCRGVSSKFFQFADDLLLLRGRRVDDDINKMQEDIDIITKNSLELGLQMNTNKVKHMIITSKNIEHKQLFKCNNQIIPVVSSHKHLGIIIDSKLTFNEHVNHVIKKSAQQSGLIKKICGKVDPLTSLSLYKTYTLPLLEYGYTAWKPSKTQQERLEKTQKHFTKYVCSRLGFNDLSYHNRLRLLSIKSLTHRRSLKQMKTLKQMIENNTMHDIHIRNNPRTGTRTECPLHRLVISNKEQHTDIVNIFNSMPRHVRDSLNDHDFITKVDYYFEYEYEGSSQV